nr:MAG TPA: hypothetical protein [Caudoviricetes sp.]
MISSSYNILSNKSSLARLSLSLSTIGAFLFNHALKASLLYSGSIYLGSLSISSLASK